MTQHQLAWINTNLCSGSCLSIRTNPFFSVLEIDNLGKTDEVVDDLNDDGLDTVSVLTKHLKNKQNAALHTIPNFSDYI